MGAVLVLFGPGTAFGERVRTAMHAVCALDTPDRTTDAVQMHLQVLRDAARAWDWLQLFARYREDARALSAPDAALLRDALDEYTGMMAVYEARGGV